MFRLLKAMVANASGIGGLRRERLSMVHAVSRPIEPVGGTAQVRAAV